MSATAVSLNVTATDAQGQPETVLYQVLPALLLNELQRQAAEIVALRGEVARLVEALSRLAPAPSAR